VTYKPTCHHVKNLAITSSQSNPEILAAREVLAYPYATFYPYTCRLCRGATDALIVYDDTRQQREGDDHD
jgi:hypothetical protein